MTYTILVVEDDIHLMEGIREILELDGYRIITASSGLDGLEVLKTMHYPPDLILSDIMMPKMDGYEFFRHVRANRHWLLIPFIFLTAKGEKADVRFGKLMGVDDYVTKPFSAEDLLVAVKSRLGRIDEVTSALSGQISEMKRRILTILNHEFRTPLTYVVAYADMLSRDVDQMSLDELREFLRGINSGADRLRRLVENFIFLVELDTGEVQMNYDLRKKQLDDFHRLINLAFKPQKEAFEHLNQTLVVEVDPNTPPILGDEEYLSLALARLLDNASKFSPEGSQIEVFAHTRDNHPAITVRDYGRGIPQAEIAHIFESFYQINRQKFEDQGAGSGLAIVKGVATIHGATVHVDSKEGQGSAFTLEFLPPVTP